jgi:excisionase family DNA binding protein
MTVPRTDVIKLRESGLTLREIGSRLGISAERVRQILKGKSNHRKTIVPSFDPPLSTSDVARLLNIHTNTVRRWSTNGTLKTYRVGPRGDRRFKRLDVEKLLEKYTPANST